MPLILSLFFIFLLVIPLYGEISSTVLEDLRKDFEPLNALIIGIEGNEVILDKGKAQGVKPKDIFTVYKKVKKIVHPETKESLGFLKEPIGKIEVLRVDENFSTARILYKKEDFPIPAHTRKNADLKILILYDGAFPDESLFITLKNLLPESEIILDPHVKFSNLSAPDLHARKIDLILAVGPRYIKIYNAYLDLVRAYGSPFINKAVSLTEPPKLSTSLEIPFSLEIKQKNLLGKMPGEVIQAEITDLDGDGTLDLIYFTQEEIMAVQIKGGLLAKYKPEKGDIISFSVGPSGWVAVNIYQKNIGLRSEILKYTNGAFQPVIKNLNLILQFVDYAGTGQKDTLLAQTFDPETFYGKEVYIVKREGNSLQFAKKIEMPSGFRLIGSNFVDLDGDGLKELLTFLEDGRLAIFKGHELIYSTPFSSAKHFYIKTLSGGKPGQEVTKAIIVPIISPLVQDFNGDGRKDLLFVKAEFPLERVARELKSLPLNQGHFQFYFLSYQGTYYFRTLNLEEKGVLTGLGLSGRTIFYLTTKGIYPGKTETELYSILY